jgi:membrane protease YdiL (CAAX protease family)
VVGLVLVIGDRAFARALEWEGFPHPEFPLSLIVSATAGIGEEILFRLFVMTLWAWLLYMVLRRWKAKRTAFWIANVIAALAFGAGHLPGVMAIVEVRSPAELDPLLLAELFLLNGIVGLVAGERFIRDGLVAAVGVHFWTDIVWHVAWPLARG